jgi:hypothetical protein
LLENFYSSLFVFYNDYDFRNWQNLELFEDSYWEYVVNSNLFDEYAALREFFFEKTAPNEHEQLFFTKNKITSQPAFSVISYTPLKTENFYTNSLYADEFFFDLKTASSDATNHLALFSENVNFEDSYESNKMLRQ